MEPLDLRGLAAPHQWIPGYFEVTLRTMAWGAAVAATLGILAAIGPSVAVARMSVVEGLRTLD